MGNLWNVDNTGNLTVGSIGTRTISNIQTTVLPYSFVNAASFNGVLNTITNMFFGSSWTYNFPSGGQPGDRVEIISSFAGGTIQLPAFNYVSGSNRSSSLGGTLTTTDKPAFVRFICEVASGQTKWLVENVTGNWLVTSSPDNFYLNGVFGGSVESPLSVAGKIIANDISTSTSISTGSLVTQGGVGINGNMNSKGMGLFLQTNGAIGIATMATGNALVPNTAISANSYPVAISMDNGVIGTLRIINKTVGVGFTIQSTLGSDAGQVFWFILNTV